MWIFSHVFLFSVEAPHIGKAKVSSALMGVFAEYRAVMTAAQKKEALLLREPADKVGPPQKLSLERWLLLLHVHQPHVHHNNHNIAWLYFDPALVFNVAASYPELTFLRVRHCISTIASVDPGAGARVRIPPRDLREPAGPD
jgi:hypothetical protein